MPFSSLSGFVEEDASNQANDYSTVTLLPTSSGCYSGVGTVPLQGGVYGAGTLNATSFQINGQILAVLGNEDTTGQTFTGTYTVTGGCADGDTGTLAGQRYTALTGTYTGALASSPAAQLQLTLNQDAGGTGMATFLVAGSGKFTGFGCFTSGTLAGTGAGTVSGGYASLTFATNDPAGAQLQLVGTFNPAATTLTLSSVQIIGGSCPGALGAATLKM